MDNNPSSKKVTLFMEDIQGPCNKFAAHPHKKREIWYNLARNPTETGVVPEKRNKQFHIVSR